MPQPPNMLKTTQLLIFSLVLGVVVFAAVVGVLAMQPGAPGRPTTTPANPGLGNTMLLIAGALGVTVCSAPFFLTTVITNQARDAWERSTKDDAARAALPARFQVLAIMRGALFEGFGLFCAAAALITGEVLFLAGALFAALLMLATFPTTGRWRDFHRRVTGEELGAFL